MKIKSIIYVLIASMVLNCGYSLASDSMAAVVLAGGVIKAKNVDNNNKKYKRKDCPVCKGKGWYMSGDGISKVTCGYCEEEEQNKAAEAPPKLIIRRR